MRDGLQRTIFSNFDERRKRIVRGHHTIAVRRIVSTNFIPFSMKSPTTTANLMDGIPYRRRRVATGSVVYVHDVVCRVDATR